MPDQPVDQSTPRRGSRLSVDDWLEAATQILVDDGIDDSFVPPEKKRDFAAESEAVVNARLESGV